MQPKIALGSIRKPEVKGSSPFAGSIEIKQLQAPPGCLFWFVDTTVDKIGPGGAYPYGVRQPELRSAAFLILVRAF